MVDISQLLCLLWLSLFWHLFIICYFPKHCFNLFSALSSLWKNKIVIEKSLVVTKVILQLYLCSFTNFSLFWLCLGRWFIYSCGLYVAEYYTIAKPRKYVVTILVRSHRFCINFTKQKLLTPVWICLVLSLF